MKRIPYVWLRSAYVQHVGCCRPDPSASRRRDTKCYARSMYSHNRLNVNRIPYFWLRSAYSTHRMLPPGSFRVQKKGYEEVRYIFKVHVFTKTG